MKIGDIVKSRHTGQEYRVVEMNKKHKCAYVCVPLNPEKYTFFDDKFPYGKPQTDEVARGSGTESMAVRD